MIEPFKIKVESESHSREIQEWIFNKGINWNSGSQVPLYTTSRKTLFVDYCSVIPNKLVLTSPVIGSFCDIELPEKWFYNGKLQDKPKPQTLPEFKIKVESPEQSRKLQEFLFSMGCNWSTSRKIDQEVRNLEYKYLYLENTRKEPIPRLTITNAGFFDSLKLPEKWFYDGQLQDKPKTQTHPQLRTYRQVIEALLVGTKLQSLEPSGDWKPIDHIEIDVRHLDSECTIEVRVKPRICNGVELDPCLAPEQLKKNTYYHYPDPMHVDFYGSKLWVDDGDDHYWFELGFAYATRESAAKHGQAMGRYI